MSGKGHAIDVTSSVDGANLTATNDRLHRSRKDNAVQIPADSDHDQEDLSPELKVSGSFYLDQTTGVEVEVRRSMVILTSEGGEVGRVAGVIVERHEQLVTHILLHRVGQMPEYRIVPIALIERVYGEKVLLLIFNQDLDTLPTWRGS
jgi:hypothetical protein